MTTTEKLEEKYPTHIIKYVRQNLGLEEEDTSQDERIMGMSKGQVFKRVLEWNGLLGGYDYTIKGWVESVYGIDLDEVDEVEDDEE